MLYFFDKILYLYEIRTNVMDKQEVIKRLRDLSQKMDIMFSLERH